MRGRADALDMESIRRRRAISTTLGLLLAFGSVGVVSVAAVSSLTAQHSATHALPAASPAARVAASAAGHRVARLAHRSGLRRVESAGLPGPGVPTACGEAAGGVQPAACCPSSC